MFQRKGKGLSLLLVGGGAGACCHARSTVAQETHMGGRQGQGRERGRRTEERGCTHKMTNLRGLIVKRAKERTKQAKAPRLQAPKIRSRSHLLTIPAAQQHMAVWSALGQ